MQTLKPIERLQQLLPELFNPQSQSGDLFLKFQLDPQIQATIPLGYVVETLQVAADLITPIPNMPTSVLGLMNLKGRVFWVVDLPRMLALSGGGRSRQHEIIVVQSLVKTNLNPGGTNEGLLLGLSVPQIRGTLRLSADSLTAIPEDYRLELQPYLQGQIRQDGETWIVLNVEAIAHSQSFTT